MGEELADSAIYLLGLAEMAGVDLQNEIAAKIEKNAARVYHRLPSGVPPAQSRPAYVSRLTRYMSANEPSMLAIVNV